jgi:two-component system response regulator FixJ
MNVPNRPARVVYVVDDNASVRGSLERLLTLSNWTVRAFSTAEAFLAQVSEMPSGCLVLDLKLPGMNGFDLIRRLTATGSPLPIIVISGSHYEDAESEVLRLGASLILDKPFDPQVLLRAIERALA